MCYFILISVREADLPVLKKTFTQSLDPVRNGFASKVSKNELTHLSAPSGKVTSKAEASRNIVSFLVSEGFCACPLYSAQRMPVSPEESQRKIEKLKTKLKQKKAKKKGWTEDRVQKEVERLLENELKRNAGFEKGLSPSLLGSIQDFLKYAPQLSLLVYWFDRETVLERRQLSAKALMDENCFINENIVYEIKSDSQQFS